MERIVIVAYKPKEGKEEELMELMKTHWQKLNTENLVSPRKPIVMQSSDGTLVEIFGWKSQLAIEEAHSNPIVQKMWADFGEVCQYVPIGDLEECTNLFSQFTPVN